jgi:DNA polymerase-3 subunit gamma/tau
MVLLNGVINKGFDGGLLIQGLAKHVRNVLMARDPQTLPLLEVSDQMRARYEEQAKKCQIPFLYDALKLMNQCDINYRQSSNKRLLVELTLIEIAQITQPAEDGASAGRKPRRLKSLFKNIIQQQKPKNAAPQVAAAKVAASATAAVTAAASESATANTANKASTAATKTTTTSKPKLSLGNIGFSFKKMGQKNNETQKGGMQIIPGSINMPTGQDTITDAQFTQTDLEFQWMAMCNRMPQKLSGIATRMKNMNPEITEFPKVEVVVDNDLIKQDIEEIQKSIAKTLQIYLHNDQIQLSVRVAEQTEHVKILSRREQFEQMAEKNAAVAKLQQAFDLELA